jgi:hypothetical protein
MIWVIYWTVIFFIELFLLICAIVLYLQIQVLEAEYMRKVIMMKERININSKKEIMKG